LNVVPRRDVKRFGCPKEGGDDDKKKGQKGQKDRRKVLS